MTRDEILGYVEDSEETIFLEGLDECIVGWTFNQNDNAVIIYDRDKLVKAFMEKGMSFDDANEYVHVNIEWAYCGECTPIIMRYV